MNKIVIALLLGLLLMMASCKKDKNTTWQYSNSFSNERIKTEQHFSGSSLHVGAVSYYSYDAQNRIICHAIGPDSLLYSYSGDSMIMTQRGTYNDLTVYFLTNGLADSSYDNYDLYTGMRFYFDGNKQLKKTVHSNNGQSNITVDYNYVNGNEVGYTNTSSSGTIVETADFFTDKENSINNENFGLTYLGRNSVNLVKSYTENLSPNTVLTYNNRYYYDSRGRVSAAVTYRDNNSFYDSAVYTYY